MRRSVESNREKIPDKVELEMADALMSDGPVDEKLSGKKKFGNKPKIDETLYDL